MYGKTIDGVLYVVDEPRAGYKPFTYTGTPEAPDGYHTAYIWCETEKSFEQIWEVIKDYEEEPTVEAKAEAYDILIGGTP